LVQAQYKAGGANYLQVLTAEQAYQNATLALVKARAQRFLDTAACSRRSAAAGGIAPTPPRPSPQRKESPDDEYPGAGGRPRARAATDGGGADRRGAARRLGRGRRVRMASLRGLVLQKVHGAGGGRAADRVHRDGREDPWQAQVHAIGSLRAVRGADLSAQASGVVDAIEFDSGNDVPAGKVLLRLRPNDDFAKLDQLEAAAELAGRP
jgi:hypothetical protein